MDLEQGPLKRVAASQPFCHRQCMHIPIEWLDTGRSVHETAGQKVTVDVIVMEFI